MSLSSAARFAPPILLMLCLAACSPGGTQRGDVAVRVNDKDISVERFQQVLAQADFAQTTHPDRERLMEALVARELLAQQARRVHLDRNPFVVHALEGAQTGILAQAYVEHVTLSRPVETREIEDFYARNPALFKQRRVYRVFELAVIAPEAEVDALKVRLARTRSLIEIAEWLRSRQIAFNVGGVTSSTENIAPELLQRLDQLKDGQLAMIEVPGGASVIQLIQSESAPLSLEQATPRIEQLLRAGRQAEVAQSQVEQLRRTATIQYVLDLKGEASQSQPTGAIPTAARP